MPAIVYQFFMSEEYEGAGKKQSHLMTIHTIFFAINRRENRSEETIQMSKILQFHNQEYGFFFPKPLLKDSLVRKKRLRTSQLDICL